MHDIVVASKIGKKFITDVDSCKASGPGGIPVVVLKNCEPEFLCILSGPF